MQTMDPRIIIDRQIRDIYLSCSWRKEDAGFVTFFIKELDSNDFRAVGDVQVPNLDWDEGRVLRIMRDCSAFICILPYRELEEFHTSKYVLRELELAARLGIPAFIFYERGIILSHGSPESITIEKEGNKKTIQFAKDTKIHGPIRYDDSDHYAAERLASEHIQKFKNLMIDLPVLSKPYAFLITRLKEDFKQGREAIRCAIENKAGISCIWSNDERHHIEGKKLGDRERIQFLMQHAKFIVAELSLGNDKVNSDSLSRAHEFGMAMAFGKNIFITAQKGRDAYYSADDRTWIFWENEAELKQRVEEFLGKHETEICRHVYNYDLDKTTHKPKIGRRKFEYKSGDRYYSPQFPLNARWSWAVAAGFGLMALGLPVIFKKLLQLDNFFEFAAIIGGIFTMVFASNVNDAIRRAIIKHPLLRILVMIFGGIALAGFIYYFESSPPVAGNAH
jgi:hypothetical protein